MAEQQSKEPLRIKINAHPVGRQSRVEIAGTDFSRHLRRIEVDIDVDRLTSVVLHLQAVPVEIDGQVYIKVPKHLFEALRIEPVGARERE